MSDKPINGIIHEQSRRRFEGKVGFSRLDGHMDTLGLDVTWPPLD